ncbi:MAG: histidine--tRNA ligase [Bacilli bacterium]|nr:histidine--tRNA ligase [Bacilli bacterium]
MIQRQKGTIDIYGDIAKKWKYIDSIVDMVAEKYNYGYIRTPIFEDFSLFHRGIGDSTDIVSKETYDFLDKGGRRIALRPEGTAGVVRAYIENKMFGDPVQPKKFYYNGTMYRYERPQSGRDREFTQFGAEILGSDDPISDAEVIALAISIFKMLGLKDLKVKLNTLGDTESRNKYRQVLIDHFKPHIDEFCEDCKERINKNPLRILDCKIDNENKLMKTAPKTIDYLNDESRERFEKVQEYLDVMGIDYEVDPTIVRGLDYYNHTVFEIEDTNPNMGLNKVILGGGRYNGLAEQIEGPATPGVGWASGAGRVVDALEAEGVELPIDDGIDMFFLYVNDEEKRSALYYANELREAGYSVDTEFTGKSLKSQFKKADRLNARYIAVLNSEDLKNGEIKIKNNQTKEEEVVSAEALIYFMDEKLNTFSEEDFDIDELMKTKKVKEDK